MGHYLKEELKKLAKEEIEFPWPKLMLKYTNSIGRGDSMTKFQKKYYYEIFKEHNHSGKAGGSKSIGINKTHQEKPSNLEISTVDTNINLGNYINQTYMAEKDDLMLTNLIDDTGYTALSLPPDDFLKKLLVIKNQMKQPDHPLTEFIKCFDNKFWEAYSMVPKDE